MKKYYCVTALVCLAVLAVFAVINRVWEPSAIPETIHVGFVFENDEITPYTYNFFLANRTLLSKYGDSVQIHTRTNVRENETTEQMEALIREGCTVLFTNTYSTQVKELAKKCPEIDFCQVSFDGVGFSDMPENYHTFNAEIYQGRYVSGVAAGLKLRELLDKGELTPEQALVGYVGSFSTPEVLSGYTAFLLGVRSVAPEAVMRVRYTGSWSNYSLEKAAAKALIEDGCVILSHHTDTIGPAIACEDAAITGKPIFFVGYGQNMLDVAPASTLISLRVNWAPYITGTVAAKREEQRIEKTVKGRIQNNDICAGFDYGWIDMLDLNKRLATENMQKKLDDTIKALKNGSLKVFRGDYTGVDPNNSADTINLKQGYDENSASSVASFHYVLQDIITIVD